MLFRFLELIISYNTKVSGFFLWCFTIYINSKTPFFLTFLFKHSSLSFFILFFDLLFLDLIQWDKVFILESQNLKWEDQHIKYGENSWHFSKILEFLFWFKNLFYSFIRLWVREMKGKFIEKRLRREEIVVWPQSNH
jgi:hypothetical protein